MPIRMEEDANQNKRGDNYPQDNNPRRPSTGGGGLTSLLPLLLSVLFKRPKMAMLLIVAAALFYFLGGGSLFSSNEGNIDIEQLFGTGLNMDQKVYDKALVYEALADNAKNPMPERISLEKFCPVRLNQGRQGSCVGWASSYAARTILHSRATGINPNRTAFSPSYLYNQIALKGCQGAYLHNAMETMKQRGVLPFSQFAYDERRCNVLPDQMQARNAIEYRTRGFNRLSKNGNNYKTDLLAIKQNLAQGAPVVIGMMVGGSFFNGMRGRDTWIPTQRDYNQSGFGGHAMCVIGYDDYKAGGAFQIMNSWGEEWGDEGIAWVRYKDFEYFVKEAYGLFPMGDANRVQTAEYKVNFGLINTVSGRNLSMVKKGETVFGSQTPIKKGDKFKVEVTNSVECYTYIFGMETDGSSYVLFPYTKKHSPYCGITGTRVFPRDHSLVADNIGNRDYIAVVFTKDPIDYNALNAALSKNKQVSYAQRLQYALGNPSLNNVRFTTGNTIGFSTASKKEAIGFVIEIDKN